MAAGNPSYRVDSLLYVHAVEALVPDGHSVRLLLRPVLRHFRPAGLLRRPLLRALCRAILLRRCFRNVAMESRSRTYLFDSWRHSMVACGPIMDLVALKEIAHRCRGWRASGLTMRCSERLPAARPRFPMIKTLPLRLTLAPGSRR